MTSCSAPCFILKITLWSQNGPCSSLWILYSRQEDRGGMLVRIFLGSIANAPPPNFCSHVIGQNLIACLLIYAMEDSSLMQKRKKSILKKTGKHVCKPWAVSAFDNLPSLFCSYLLLEALHGRASCDSFTRALGSLEPSSLSIPSTLLLFSAALSPFPVSVS